MRKRILTPLVCLVLLWALMPLTAFAAEVPYQTYTYDKWGVATPAPNGYIPSRSIGGAQLGCGDFSGAMDLYYCEEQGCVYVSDTGNSRIVILDENMQFVSELRELTQADGGTYTLNKPQGVFVSKSGSVYICDTGNQKVIECTRDGRMISLVPRPESNLLPDNFVYQPTKMVVDDVGRMYIISKGTYQGLIDLDTDGSFIKFFGPNDVEMTFRRRVLQIWKNLLSDEAAATLQSFNPIEYGNIFLSSDGYIYATAAASENGAALMTKLNPLGIDCSRVKLSGTSLFSDVTVDENQNMTLLDTRYGTIYQYDENGQEMFIFGGIGNQVGLFQKAVSIIEVNDNLYVLDSEKNTITEFTLTQFGAMVHEAINLYNEGLYQESVEPWNNVVSHNANYLLGYTGLGKAYYQMKDYDTAMYYFKLANNRTEYSRAYKEYSLNKVRESFSTVVLVIAVIAIGGAVARKVLKRVRRGRLAAQKGV